MAAAGKPDYGLDAPGVVKSMFSRAAWCLGLGFALYFVNHTDYPAVAGRLLGVLGTMGLIFLATGLVMVWSSRVAKLHLRDRLLDSIAFRGDERVLDVGCGRGLMLIGAARRL